MLGDMKAKVVRDVDAEKRSFEEFMRHCDSATRDRASAVKVSEQDILRLSATVDDAAATIAGLSDEISQLGSAVAGKEAELDAARSLRTSQRDEFQAAEKDLLRAIDQIGKAEAEAKKASGFLQLGDGTITNTSGLVKVAEALGAVVDATSLVGVQHRRGSSRRTSAEQREVGRISLVSLESEASEGEDTDDADSGNVVAVLDSTKERAEKQLHDLRKAETEAQQSFELTQQGVM